MKVVVLSSGSKGNTTLVEDHGVKILIDLGNTCKYVQNKLEDLGIQADSIDGILITHTHVDHIKGLKVFLKKYPVKVYLTEKMKEELDFVSNYQVIENYGDFSIGGILVHVFRTSHDVADSVGYVIEADHKSLVYVTDTGYIHQKYFPLLKNRDIYIMESNHDIEMLNHSSYSFALRQRILGDKGHLSNYDSARYLSSLIGSRTKCIMLAHLSEENNREEIAYQTLLERLQENGQEVEQIIIAKQNEETKEVLI